MKVLVTGGAGFIGTHSVRALLDRGHVVEVVDDLSRGKRESVTSGVALHVLDVRSPELCGLLKRFRPDAVLHLAAQMDVRKSVADPAEDASINVLGTVNALEAARVAGVRRFVFASSGGAVYGEPEGPASSETDPRRPASPYGVSKLCGEEYLGHYTRAHGLSGLALRYANVYGPGQDATGEAGVVAIFCGKMNRGDPPAINGDGEQTRDYVHVADVARANLLALEGTAEGYCNIGTGRETSVLEVARLLAVACRCTAPFRYRPAAPGEQRRSVIDPSAARSRLGWTPLIGLEEGLAATATSFREH